MVDGRSAFHTSSNFDRRDLQVLNGLKHGEQVFELILKRKRFGADRPAQ